MSNDNVTIICSGKEETRKRKEAYDFYSEGANECDGSEADRYASIVFGLVTGCKTCNDEWAY